jgi:hypothetical protein
MTRTRIGLLPGLLLVLALAVAACGGGGGGNSNGVASLGDKATATTRPGGGKDSKQQMLAYARCMRQHGINMPDPKLDAAGRAAQQMPRGVGPDDPKYKAADQACRQYLPNGGEPEKPDPQTQQQMVAFARCMRQHGIDIPDPKPGGGIDADAAKGVDLNSPKFKAAQQACQQYQPKGGSGAVNSGPQGPGGSK